jgi:hypothetical protein
MLTLSEADLALLTAFRADPAAVDWLQEVHNATLGDVLALYRGTPDEYQDGIPGALLAHWCCCTEPGVTRPEPAKWVAVASNESALAQQIPTQARRRPRWEIIRDWSAAGVSLQTVADRLNARLPSRQHVYGSSLQYNFDRHGVDGLYPEAAAAYAVCLRDLKRRVLWLFDEIAFLRQCWLNYDRLDDELCSPFRGFADAFPDFRARGMRLPPPADWAIPAFRLALSEKDFVPHVEVWCRDEPKGRQVHFWQTVGANVLIPPEPGPNTAPAYVHVDDLRRVAQGPAVRPPMPGDYILQDQGRGEYRRAIYPEMPTAVVVRSEESSYGQWHLTIRPLTWQDQERWLASHRPPSP